MKPSVGGVNPFSYTVYWIKLELQYIKKININRSKSSNRNEQTHATLIENTHPINQDVHSVLWDRAVAVPANRAGSWQRLTQGSTVKDHSQILLRELREYMWKLKQKPQTSINANWTGFKNWSWFQIGYVESRVVPSAGFNLKDLAVPTW